MRPQSIKSRVFLQSGVKAWTNIHTRTARTPAGKPLVAIDYTAVGTTVTLTPDAARALADRIHAAADKAEQKGTNHA